jgi:hypothetical protein
MKIILFFLLITPLNKLLYLKVDIARFKLSLIALLIDLCLKLALRKGIIPLLLKARVYVITGNVIVAAVTSKRKLHTHEALGSSFKAKETKSWR